jgi:aldehyde dehydrogenase (NAD+)
MDAVHEVAAVRKSFNAGVSRPIEWRLQQLNSILKMIDENRDSAFQALYDDLRQNRFLASVAEIDLPIQEVQYHLANLHNWMKPEERVLDPMMQPGKAFVIPEPFGVVLIIAPWNYPLSLALKPLIGAISAGNCVILKPSEVSPNCSRWLTTLIPKYLDTNCIKVVEGGPQETTVLLREPFDYIFYTGNTTVGRIIMKAAAEHLTPVTLELGGKSPCIVDREVDLDVAARRIASGKFQNAGQTCVAPDYLLVHRDVETAFTEKLRQAITQFYGSDPQKSVDYSRIINQRHTQRLADLLQGEQGTVITGGQVDVQDRYIAPTLVRLNSTTAGATSKLMADEIFGPILPIMPVDSVDSAIEFVNNRPKPLALYVFSTNNTTARRVLSSTSSGGACINETVFHVAIKTLPFGGVGPSGMGAYNGKHTFDTFSHYKSVLDHATWLDPDLRYPPFTDRKIWWFQTLGKLKMPSSRQLLLFLLPLVLSLGGHYVWQYFSGGEDRSHSPSSRL